MDFAAVLAIFCIFGLPIIAYIVVKVLAHQERLELIRRGYAPPPDGNWKKAQQMMGGPMPPPPPPYPGPPPPAPAMYDLEGPQRQLNKGIMVALIGLAITIGLSFVGMDDGGPFGSPGFHPTPALLGGLIPMFVGIAQIITAVLGGAQLGVPGRRGVPPPPGMGPAAGSGSPFSQPGSRRTYGPPPPPPPRPNPSEELPPPINPLDRR